MAIDTDVQAELQRKAKEHLWLHFSSMGSYRDQEVPIIERGEGPYLFDVHGKRYLDMLSGLFTVQIGYSYGEELGQAALEQMRKLPYYTNWTFAHPPAAELAARLAELAPREHQPRVLRLGRLRGRRVGLEARAPVPRGQRPAHAAQGHLAQGRVPRHDDGRPLDHRHHRDPHALRAARRRRAPRRQHQSLPLQVLLACGRVHARVRGRGAETIEQEGPETVAMVIMEPVQNSGGTFTPHPAYHRRVREICDAYGVLQVADEVICAFGRLGEWFGCERYGYEPDLITCAKGLTSGYASLGAC